MKKIFYFTKRNALRLLILFLGFLFLTYCGDNDSTSTTSYISGTPPKIILSEIGAHGGDYSTNDFLFANQWIEIYNPNNFPIVLSNYQIRGKSIAFRYSDNAYLHSSGLTYRLPDFEVAAESYLLIRFSLNQYYNDAKGKNAFFFNQELNFFDGSRVYTPSLWDSSKSTKANSISEKGFGYYELIRNNQTVDYVAICPDNSSYGSEIPLPTTGSFDRCVDFDGNLGSGLTRDINLTDTDTAADWTQVAIATPGGQNDVIDTTDDDNDGIPDANEQPGTTFAGMPLYEWGARTDQKDIFLHIDYMEGWESDDGLKPHKEALEKVRNSFINAEQRGINQRFAIHIDVGNLYHSAPGSSPSDFDLSDQNHEVPTRSYVVLEDFLGSTSNILKAATTEKNIYSYKYAHMPVNRLQIFHYMLMANNTKVAGKIFPTILGFGEFPGNDSIVSLGGKHESKPKIYSINQIAFTILHELGHNLNLHHGGFEIDNNKPNYFSSMNYFYDNGLPKTNDTSSSNLAARYYKYRKVARYSHLTNERAMIYGPYTTNYRIEYSSGHCPELDKNNLIESDGINCWGLGAVDWNINGTIDNFATSYNINSDRQKIILQDNNDWPQILLPFAAKGDSRNYNDYSPSPSNYPEVIKRTLRLDPFKNDFGKWVE